MEGRQARAVPVWVVVPVVAASLGCWHLGAPYLADISPVVQAAASFLMVGVLGITARYVAARRPIVFFQDILTELGVYAVAGGASGVLILFLEGRWGVRASPVLPAVAVYVALTFLFDRRAS